MLEHKNFTQPLGHARVGDCMRPGILTCPADAALRDVAAIMATHRVHAVAITRENAGRPFGFVSDLEVVRAAAGSVEPLAVDVAVTEPIVLSAHEPVHRAAQLMSEHGVTHVIVVDAAGGYPIGVLSSLDVAAVYASDRDAAGGAEP